MSKKMHKLIHSYCISTGIVHFADDTKALFTPEAAAMVEKLIYLMTTHEGNFQEVEISYEREVSVALDSIDEL